MNIADFKSRAFTGQASWTQSRQTSLMGNLRKRIGLIHELRQLAGIEEFIDHRRNRFGIDQVVRHHGLDVLKTHFFLDGSFHTHQTDAVLVFNQFAYRTHPAVSQVINIVHTAIADAVFQVDQIFHCGQDVFVAQHGVVRRHVHVQFVIHFRASDIGQIISLRLKEQALEELVRCFRRRRIARTQTAIDLHDRILGGINLIQQQRIPDGSVIHVFINMNKFQFPDILFADNVQTVRRQFLVATKNNLTRFRIMNIPRRNFSDQFVFIDCRPFNTGLHDSLDQRLGQFSSLLDNQFGTLGVFDIFW